ncbi:MAG: hypothetical protein PVI38_19565, partial [Desulfobacterales bacterium]
MGVPRLKKSSWRDYQTKLQRERKSEARKKFLRRNLKYGVLFIAGSLAVYGLISGSFGSLFDDTKTAQPIRGPHEQLDSQKA